MKKHLLNGLAIVIVFGYFYFNFISTLSQNVVPITTEEKTVIKFFFPQGWGFFTRNPREDKFQLYSLSEHSAPELMNYKITDSKNLFGFSRKGNRICMEMIRIQNQLPALAEWEESDLAVDDFEIDTCKTELITMDQKDLLYIDPGKYLIKQYKIKPWNWLKFSNTEAYKYYSFDLKRTEE